VQTGVQVRRAEHNHCAAEEEAPDLGRATSQFDSGEEKLLTMDFNRVRRYISSMSFSIMPRLISRTQKYVLVLLP